jgi:hypothetical protein
MGKYEGKGPLGRPRLRWENIKAGFKGTEWEVMDWISLAQESIRLRALVTTVMNLRFP